MNIIINGSFVRTQFEDPLPTMGPPNVLEDYRANPQADRYEFVTQEVIRKIAGTQVGGPWIGSINSRAHQIVSILPLNERAIGETSTVAKDTAASARPGVGTGVFIWYDPFTWAGSAMKMSIDPQNHFKQDDVLFHEFVHALLMMHGLDFSTPIAGWHRVSELYAIMLTNIYNSSNNRNSDLRADHDLSFHVLPKSFLRPTEQQDDEFFYNNNQTDIDRLCGSSLQTLCNTLADVQCKWNPLGVRKRKAKHPSARAY